MLWKLESGSESGLKPEQRYSMPVSQAPCQRACHGLPLLMLISTLHVGTSLFLVSPLPLITFTWLFPLLNVLLNVHYCHPSAFGSPHTPCSLMVIIFAFEASTVLNTCSHFHMISEMFPYNKTESIYLQK